MANYRAIGAACEAILRILQQSVAPAMFGGIPLQFKVFGTQDFSSGMETGVSLFLYRVEHNASQRKTLVTGRQARPALPLDLHFLLTPWAGDPSLSNEILGWLMRALEDTAILPAGILNSAISGVFDDSERLEIVPGQLTNEEMFRIWDVLPAKFQLSVAYVARVVRIDSFLTLPEVGPVVSRQIDYQAE